MIVNRNAEGSIVGVDPIYPSIPPPMKFIQRRGNYRFNWTVRKIPSIKSLLSERAAF